jgi:hypothetical protein
MTSLEQWIPAPRFRGDKLRENDGRRGGLLVIARLHSKQSIRVPCPQGFIGRRVAGGLGRLLHSFRFAVFGGAVGGKDDLQRSQAIEPTRARRYALGHTAQEILQHQRVHVLPRV